MWILVVPVGEIIFIVCMLVIMGVGIIGMAKMIYEDRESERARDYADLWKLQHDQEKEIAKQEKIKAKLEALTNPGLLCPWCESRDLKFLGEAVNVTDGEAVVGVYNYACKRCWRQYRVAADSLKVPVSVAGQATTVEVEAHHIMREFNQLPPAPDGFEMVVGMNVDDWIARWYGSEPKRRLAEMSSGELSWPEAPTVPVLNQKVLR